MNENALRVEMGIPLLAHPKHTYSKISGLTDSNSEYSYDSEDEPDNLIQYSKEAEAKTTKNSKSDQDSLPNLVIYATPKGRTMRLEKSELNIRSAGTSGPQIDELPFLKGVPLYPPESIEDQDIKDLCHEILMVRISELHESDDDSMECLNLEDYNSDDYDEYLFNNMETTPTSITEVKTTIK
jgi:hypothetical protein